MLLKIEGLVMCFLMMLVCIVAIADGSVGVVFFFEKEVTYAIVSRIVLRKNIKS